MALCLIAAARCREPRPRRRDAVAGRSVRADAPRKGGTLRVSMPYNPASVDPMTGRNLPDFNVLYAVFDALIDFEPIDARTSARSREGVEVHRSEDAGARSCRRRHVPRRFAIQRRGGQIQSRALQDRPALECESRSRRDGESRGHRSKPGHAQPEQSQCRIAGNSDQSGRLHGVAEIDSGKGTECRSCAGRHRSVQVRELDRTTTSSRSCAMTTTGRKVCLISTASISASSTNSTPRCALP